VLKNLEALGKDNPMQAEITREIVRFLTPFIERGDLGVKAGKGFYTYPDPAYEQSEFLSTDD
jgi:enoyl-CoA hydratase/3-hydroxyacyl-CoA dehydrogenase